MRQWTVDAFADRPFRGNPACVVEPFEVWPDDAWMQALAEENKQAETAYVRRTSDPDRFELRWFTPTVEAPLCGHATLASAHVLFSELGAVGRGDPLRDAPVRHAAGGAGGARLLHGLPGGAGHADCAADCAAGRPGGGSRCRARAGLRQPLPAGDPERRGERARPASRPRQGRADRRGGQRARQCHRQRRSRSLASPIAWSAGSSRPARASRKTRPQAPPTASWRRSGRPSSGKLELDFHQAYPGRGGDLRCRLAGERVMIEGEAITVIESRLTSYES